MPPRRNWLISRSSSSSSSSSGAEGILQSQPPPPRDASQRNDAQIDSLLSQLAALRVHQRETGEDEDEDEDECEGEEEAEEQQQPGSSSAGRSNQAGPTVATATVSEEPRQEPSYQATAQSHGLIIPTPLSPTSKVKGPPRLSLRKTAPP